MELAYLLHGGAPVLKRYPVAASLAAGIPVLNAAAGGAGVATSTTTSAANMVGVTTDAATYTTTQVVGTDVQALITVIVNPLAVWRCKMSGGATENTALTVHTIDTANSAGTSVEGDQTMTNFDEGVIWGLTGTNVGRYRKITSVSGAHATVTVPFDPISVGDTFLFAPYMVADVAGNNVQLTTNLTQADASIAVGTGAAFRVVDWELNGRSNSFIHIFADDHILNATT